MHKLHSIDLIGVLFEIVLKLSVTKACEIIFCNYFVLFYEVQQHRLLQHLYNSLYFFMENLHYTTHGLYRLSIWLNHRFDKSLKTDINHT